MSGTNCSTLARTSRFQSTENREPQKTCVRCGEVFCAKPRQKFCSRVCREESRWKGLTLTCVECGKEYIGTRGSRRCSPSCYPIALAIHTEQTCTVCGKPFIKKRSRDTGLFCSRVCAGKDNKRRLLEQTPPTMRRCRVCDQWLSRKEMQYPAQSVCSEECRNRYLLTICAHCGVEFQGNSKQAKYCSDTCAWKYHADKRVTRDKPRTVRCLECNKTFFQEKLPSKTKYCSLQCTKRVAKRKRRALKREAYVEEVYLAALVLRDNGICKICNKPVDLAVAVPDNLAPTIDHVIPLSRGGEHSYGNCQLAHFLCNSQKWASIDMLF